MDTSRRTAIRPAKPLRHVLAGCAALIAFGIGTAQAQFFDPFDEMMPPRAVAWRLGDRGFTEIGRPRFDGRAYVVEATSPYGDRVRLFVDSRDGAIVGRQRLDAAPPVRVARPAPGYGWTDDDAEPRRPIGRVERLVPPADVPASDPATRLSAQERNPTGLNPAAKARPEPQRKVARLTPPAKPVAPRATPEAPKPAETLATPAAVAKPEAPAAALEAPKVVSPPTPAAVQPPMDKPPAEAAATPRAQTWQDPPAEPKRPVRVIGGATVVPGNADKEQPAATGAE